MHTRLRTTTLAGVLLLVLAVPTTSQGSDSADDSLYDPDETTDLSWETLDALDSWTKTAQTGMRLAPILSSSTIDDISIAPGGREELTISADTIQWKWDSDQTGDDGRILLRNNGWEAPGGSFGLKWMASVRHRAKHDIWAIDVKADSIGCREFLKLSPDDWLSSFGDIAVEGDARPWVELRLQNRNPRSWHFRFGGLDDCRVTDIEHLPETDWLPDDSLAGLARPFATTTEFTDNIEVGPATDDYVDFDELPDHLVAAVYLSEDPDFFETRGWNPTLVSRAVEQNLESEDFVAGGSTITQQLVKNLWLSPERTFERKVRELVLALAVADTITNERILELYVNIIEFGPETFGIGAAADHYFGKRPADLTPVESAFLAALKPSPASGELYRRNDDATPLTSEISAILETMYEYGYIDASTTEASVEELDFRR